MPNIAGLTRAGTSPSWSPDAQAGGVLAPPAAPFSDITSHTHSGSPVKGGERPEVRLPEDGSRGGEIERLGSIIERMAAQVDRLEREIAGMRGQLATAAPSSWVPAAKAARRLNRSPGTIRKACLRAYTEDRCYGQGYDFLLFGRVRGYCEQGPHTGHQRYAFALRAEDL